MNPTTDPDPSDAFAAVFARGAAPAAREADFRARVIAEIAPDATPQALDGATRLLDRKLRKRRPVATVAAFIALCLAALASAVWLIAPLPGVLRVLPTIGTPTIGTPSTAKSAHPTTGDATMDADTRLLLYGDPDAPDLASRWRALWLSEPENPAWFSRYVAHRLREEMTLDPALLAEARRLDPENGFWPLVAACIGADELLERADLPERGDEERKSGVFATDEDEVLRRLALVREAAAMPLLESHHRQWLREAISRHPPVDDFSKQVQLIILLTREMLYGNAEQRYFAGMQEAGVRIAMERGDAELAAAIIRDWHALSRCFAENAMSLVELFVAHVIVAHPVEALHEAAVYLDLADEVALLEPIVAAVGEIERHRKQPRSVEYIDHYDQKGSFLAAYVSPGIGPEILIDPPHPPSVDALRPSRRMECAAYDRLVVPPVATVLALALAIFGAAWLWAGRARRTLAKRALLLVPWWKSAALCLAAGAGPLLGYLAITRHTPLGWHEWSLQHAGIVVKSQWVLLACLLLFLPKLLAEAMLERESRVFGWRWPGGIEPRLIASLMLVLALPASGLVLMREEPGLSRYPVLLMIVFVAALLVPACIALGGLWCWWRQRKTPMRNTPRRLAAGLLAARARLLALALLVPWVEWTHHEEKSWAARDTLFVVIPESPALSAHETAIQNRLRQQILEMLGPPWPR